MNAIDTNIWVYSIDHDEPERREQALDLLDRLGGDATSTVMLWQVAGEYPPAALRAGQISSDDECNVSD